MKQSAKRLLEEHDRKREQEERAEREREKLERSKAKPRHRAILPGQYAKG